MTYDKVVHENPCTWQLIISMTIKREGLLPILFEKLKHSIIVRLKEAVRALDLEGNGSATVQEDNRTDHSLSLFD